MYPLNEMISERRVETSVSLAKSERRKKAFLASIPLDWVARAGKLPGKALQVALAIRHQCALERKSTISLGNNFLYRMNVKRDAKRRAIAALEIEGLIKVQRESGKKPLIEVLKE